MSRKRHEAGNMDRARDIGANRWVQECLYWCVWSCVVANAKFTIIRFFQNFQNMLVALKFTRIISKWLVDSGTDATNCNGISLVFTTESSHNMVFSSESYSYLIRDYCQIREGSNPISLQQLKDLLFNNTASLFGMLSQWITGSL